MMRNGEWRLVYPGCDLTFGTRATPIFNRATPVIADADIRSADGDRARADGRSFGTDYRNGASVTFDLGVRAATETDARAQAALLTRAWRGDAVAKTAGAVAELHSCYAGRERIAYGRPRRFGPDYADATLNLLVGATADFAMVDDLFYDAVENAADVSLVPPVSGGLVAPLASPLSTTATSDRSTVMTVGGELSAWPVIEISGPLINPVVEIVGLWSIELRTTLAYDDVVTLDTRPWVRSALRNGTGNVAGKLRGTRLAAAAIPPGSYEVALRGVDATGTSSVRLRWRNTYSTL